MNSIDNLMDIISKNDLEIVNKMSNTHQQYRLVNKSTKNYIIISHICIIYTHHTIVEYLNSLTDDDIDHIINNVNYFLKEKK